MRGKPLFFPIVNVTADNCGLREDEQYTDEENRAYSAEQMSLVAAMTLEIDGEAGTHELHFAATIGEGEEAFDLDVTYHLIVE